MLQNGISNSTNSSKERVEFKSADGKESITAVASWKSETVLSGGSVIQVANRSRGGNVQVDVKGKDSFEWKKCSLL